MRKNYNSLNKRYVSLKGNYNDILDKYNDAKREIKRLNYKFRAANCTEA
jgi:hypothetical protein